MIFAIILEVGGCQDLWVYENRENKHFRTEGTASKKDQTEFPPYAKKTKPNFNRK